MQGALLEPLTGSIYLSSITIGDYYEAEAAHRAFISRLGRIGSLPERFALHAPLIRQTCVVFEHSQLKLPNAPSTNYGIFARDRSPHVNEH